MLQAVTKLCKKCGVEKPTTEFYVNKTRNGGLAPYCKECTKAYNNDRYHNDPTVKDKARVRLAVRKQDPEFVAAARQRSERHFQSIKGRAKSLLRCAERSPDGCSLTLEWVIDGIRAGICPITGIAFDLTNDHQKITGRAKNPYAPSLDRIEPKGPYSPENTRIVIWQYNMMKGEVSDAEMFYLCRLIAARHPA